MRKLSTEGVLEEIKNITFRQLHIHHTWRPNHGNFNGNNHIELNQNMKNYHVNNNGWSDIAQHLSLFPDGEWVTGRDYWRQPASILGWNNRSPLMVEMIGNFDKGNDRLEGKQRESIVRLVKYFIDKYGESSIVFHRDHPSAGKTCPGTSVIKSDLIREAKALSQPTPKPIPPRPKITVETDITKIKIDNKDIALRTIHERKEGLTQYIAVRDLECLGYEINWLGNSTSVKKDNIYRTPNLNLDFILDNLRKEDINIVYEGKQIKLNGYITENNYDGGKMQFIKVRDLQEFGYDISWDSNTKSVIAKKIL